MVEKRTSRRAAGLLVAAAAAVLSAACGGDSGDAGTGNSGGGGPGGAFTAYTDCLKNNGVTITMPSGGPRESGARPSGMPRPSGSAGPGGGGFPGGGGMAGKPAGVDDATWQKAQEACSSLRPSGRPGGEGRGNGQNAAYQNCLKENGVTDPSTLDTTDATTRKAIETCRVLQPTAAPSA
ncbi:hypothetical protein Aab01nite_47800 [Paractinoplanes abujensis]|uniref:PT repeat-containing protein n=1 Tax=Paractinoplanes abujensis TaxID=882441 RepID=A0A7W7CP98_9ACTN|nr:hypothetical protein [Actinoplanes abujensis]MBB4690426.1 hypothetical protein [Actinoplanes abujensis]GID21190.1 hypothetical protein Aab01nite_47800 [Actinoplanes abujensis]